MILAIALLAQAQAQAAPGTPQRFSILTPPCPADASAGADIVVCAGTASPTRLPLPAERPPVGPLPINPALMVDPAPRPGGGAPCAARLEGCLVGFGPPLMPIVDAIAGLARGAVAKRPDRRGRIAIPLDDPPVAGASTPAVP